MLKNYLTIAWRTMSRHKGYSFINIAGLAAGLACCLLIGLYVRYEASYDRFHNNAERIYRVTTERGKERATNRTARTAGPVAPAVNQAIPEVLHAVRLLVDGEFYIERGDVGFQETGIYFADSSFFDVFSFPLLRGNAQMALREPFTAVLTTQAARKYFGDEDPVGQTLRVNEQTDMTVTGVIENPPPNSHLQFDFVASMATAEALQSASWLFENWSTDAFFTYTLVPAEHDADALARNLTEAARQHADPRMLTQEPGYALALEPLTDIYLYSDLAKQAGPTGNAAMLVLLGTIGGLILVIACINFMNLATARAAERAKEVGVRKSVGAQRSQVAGQFLAESVLSSLLAMGVAMGLAWLLLPLLSALVGKPLDINAPGQVGLAVYGLALVGLVLGTGLLAGSYPALVLSRYRPVVVLKGQHRPRVQDRPVRQGLVVVQFGASVALVAVTIVVFAQLDYLRGTSPGFATDQTMLVSLESIENIEERYDALRAELRALPVVEEVAASASPPAGDGLPDWLMNIEDAQGTVRRVSVPFLPVDFNFISLYDLNMVAGRAFDPDIATDATEAIIINEAAAALLGYYDPAEAIGKPVRQIYPRDAWVIGVVQDFNFRSLHQPIQPLAMRILPSQYGTLSVLIRGDDMQETVQAVEDQWAAVVPDRAFTYRFLDTVIDAQYRAEERFVRIFSVFAGLAILIATLGLFGLSAFTAQQRTKEIGIRKTLGASVTDIVRLLCTDLLRLVAVAALLSVPVAYLAVQQWLSGYAYRVDVQAWMFAGAAALALLVALLTVSYQSFKAAHTDPVDSLRYE